MLASTKTILNAARQCLFQHGYSASSIAMISRYAGISRVTIHKQFGSKEQLLRALVRQEHHDHYSKLASFVEAHDDVWQQLEAMLLDWGRPLFEEITDQLVMSDLVKSCSDLCQDIFDAHAEVITEFVVAVLKRAELEQKIDFALQPLTPEEFADMLVVTAKAIFTISPMTGAKQALINNLAIYRAALTPKSVA
ncbi:TetR/AcrR family transcriptional regulator; helix-turn-helix transcriptional regulator [Neiella marina]|uniref:TetR/AcrR family transcriptional regulator helix-turn-helix transcriptional regulator n=1 Tax=Neiella holothuriorum TaxID=2870530 RepID=A0ABS7EHC8_9GAMM|nr:TetR/AcrR family transcriptional regulator [Neiella holothuriorum]MBW8191725.1 TetR/AcrR family transcriptional regulator; helix-turn-helix transcriptional regulator [Neiella holothuriorum]